MGRQRKSYSAAFEAQVALAAIRGDCTANELAAKHGLHPTLISNWKTALLGGAESFFAAGGKSAPRRPARPRRTLRADRPAEVGPGAAGKKLPDG